MIKFFSKIRQRLLRENKFNNYLLYAVGEVVLVVIGILIALQINNWNEERKDRIELENYLIKIADNIDQDIKTLNRLQVRRDTVFIQAKRSAKLLMEQDFTDFETMIGGIRCFYEFYFSANKSGYEALKNSQFLGRIKNPLIDSLLTSYYVEVESIEISENSYNTFIERMEVELNSSIDQTPIFEFIQSREYASEHEIDFENQEWIKKNQEALMPYLKSNAFKSAVFRTALQKNDRYQRLIRIGTKLMKEIREGVNFNKN
ncbi:DUF6090 family protein [Algoriphagus sp. SE2]|uniref:DUF6090 family protein n=1 Tax=Algoriphagus sp. SE2 TaxID=3141536 RepID=UPI0031CCFCDF